MDFNISSSDECEARNEQILAGRLLKALQESHEKNNVLQSIMDHLPSIIGYWDENLLNRFSNAAYKTYYNKTKEEIEGRHIREVIGEDLYRQNLPNLNAALQGETQFFERAIPLPDGTVKHTQTHYVPDIKDGRVRGICVLIADVTPLKIAMEEKEQIHQKLSETHRQAALGEMAGGVAHEINTPLTVMSLNLNIAERLLEESQIDRAKFKKLLSSLEQTTHRISKIVTSLLLFSKIKNTGAYERTPVGLLLSDILTLCREKYKNSGVQLIHNPCRLNLEVECYRTELSQAIMNLLNNAFEAAESSQEKWISLEALEQNEFVEIVVSDSGPGVHPEIRDKIMQPFFTTKEVGKGSGLGLSVAKGVVESHGGSLFLDTQSANTRFVMRLPKEHGKKQRPPNK